MFIGQSKKIIKLKKSKNMKEQIPNPEEYSSAEWRNNPENIKQGFIMPENWQKVASVMVDLMKQIAEENDPEKRKELAEEFKHWHAVHMKDLEQAEKNLDLWKKMQDEQEGQKDE